MASFLKLIIKEVKEKLQLDLYTFNVPEELKPNYTFVAGQYVNIKLTLDGQEILSLILFARHLKVVNCVSQ
jgi:ring-1,2-phenylacetyl-CoA epoxidase subunit PaaE